MGGIRPTNNSPVTPRKFSATVCTFWADCPGSLPFLKECQANTCRQEQTKPQMLLMEPVNRLLVLEAFCILHSAPQGW
eukprot:CAMPEP_0206490322 /NCGR_PEP_ID=MMETSP0324_2-20121206/43963_1 /ASSEMBLY_ACC=CAM_ASM_000836 /TAXON_ID=2866 /ORGANISM="Crypthecodinium cohnii, Strain Seligo" /LENGTH=77 /DNA_ID=CAMNT_0053970563 /DNA_START=143 /DNA_END=376 /DNA_ORIENTATION=+